MQVSGTFISDGIELAYYETPAAEGAPERHYPVILVHGFASHAHMNWINPGWFEALTEAGYRTIAFDNRGHGASEKRHDMEDYGSHKMARDVKALADHLGIEKTHLMGYSMGARISTFVTRQTPEIIRSLVIAGMGYNLVRGIGNPEPIARALEAERAEDVTNPAARNFRDFAEQTKRDLKALAACIRSTRVAVEPEALANITVPVLVAVGTEDVIAGDGAELAALIPTARHWPIEKRDHMRAVGDESYKKGVLEFFAEND